VDQRDAAVLQQVQVALLVVVGDQDSPLADGSAQLLVETVPGAELVVLPGADHLSAVRAKGYMESVAAFLNKHTFNTS
jgi:pimeloyl-ACP methyl ester carboxylesterase